jgi:hypothetical protein
LLTSLLRTVTLRPETVLMQARPMSSSALLTVKPSMTTWLAR